MTAQGSLLLSAPSDDPIKGAEALRLRGYFTSSGIQPMRDLDGYGFHLIMGDLPGVQKECAARVQRLVRTGLTQEEAHTAASEEQAMLRWGLTRVPIYDLLLVGCIISPDLRGDILEVARWLVNEAKVPVGGKDLSGSMTITHAISTKPSVECDLAQILYDAGEDVNVRNRYGCTPAHEICMIRPGGLPKAKVALKWFLSHGGNLDIADNDGATARKVLGSSVRACAYSDPKTTREIMKLVEEEDHRRRKLGPRCCSFCGRQPAQLLICSRCKQVKYCAPPKVCQKGHWPVHKAECVQEPRKNVYLGVDLSA